jgi:hypothetical protein
MLKLRRLIEYLKRETGKFHQFAQMRQVETQPLPSTWHDSIAELQAVMA